MVTYVDARKTEYGVVRVSLFWLKLGIDEIVGTHGCTILIVTVVDEKAVPMFVEFNVYVAVTLTIMNWVKLPY